MTAAIRIDTATALIRCVGDIRKMVIHPALDHR